MDSRGRSVRSMGSRFLMPRLLLDFFSMTSCCLAVQAMLTLRPAMHGNEPLGPCGVVGIVHRLRILSSKFNLHFNSGVFRVSGTCGDTLCPCRTISPSCGRCLFGSHHLFGAL